MFQRAHIIDGKKIADGVLQDVKRSVAKLSNKPGLAIILIGSDPASYIYVGLKEQAAQDVGIVIEKYVYPENIGEPKVMEKISELNGRKDINGILVQLPLPKGYGTDKIISAIKPIKDVDGFHPENIQSQQQGRPGLVPGLAAGIVELARSTGESLTEKKTVIISNSKIFYQPIALLMEKLGSRADHVSPDDIKLAEQTLAADVIIVAIGRPRFVKKEMVKPGAIVIDVGYNRLNGKAVGDVDFTDVSGVAGWITPVPGGVGPMTVSMLLQNVLRAYELQR
ncbi:MAG: bifunctional 5,10-methylenetetrahydrofolate dehydrogenase/5,10-methenyltetrahydrofolate cyclohydrolase [Patescibacteria group bacterium]